MKTVKPEEQIKFTDRHPMLSKAIIIAIVYWFFETFLDVYVFKLGGFMERFAWAEANEIWLRTLAITVLIGFSMYSERLLKKEQEATAGFHEKSEWLDITINSIGDAVIATDKRGVITLMNPVAERLTQWQEREAIGKDMTVVFNIVNEMTGETVENPVEKVLREGYVVGLANHTVLISKHGRRTAIEDSAAPIKDDKGDILGVIVVFHDSTEKRKAEKFIIEEKEKNKKYLDVSPNLVVVVNEHGDVDLINKNGAKMIGYDQEYIMGKNWFELALPASQRGEVKKVFEKIMSGEIGKLDKYENSIITSEGKELTISWSNTILRDDKGKISGTLSIGEDVTRQRQTEKELEGTLAELKRSNQDLEQFAYVSSHDLKEPLRISRLYAEMLKRDHFDELDDEGKEIVDDLIANSGRMSDIIKGTLDYASSDKFELKFEDIKIKSVVEELKDSIMRINSNIAFNINIDGDYKIVAELNSIKQVLRNIAINAVKYNNSEKPVIDISVHRDDDKHIFEISDNGIGIESEYIEKIFEPYEYLHTDPEMQGSGLGLAICKRIILRYGGEIWVESDVNNRPGSTFKFTIPVNKTV